MNALRRSMKSDKGSRSTHKSMQAKTPVGIAFPNLVIEAVDDWDPKTSFNALQTGKNYLAFSRGDFLNVLTGHDSQSDADWYDATNLSGDRGLVPASCFKTIGKSGRISTQSGMSSTTQASFPESTFSSATMVSSAGPPPGQGHARTSSRDVQAGGGPPANKDKKVVYGTFMYDFKAERKDELDGKAGDNIIAIAQSDPDWFVAKPISGLGGPGLVPVCYLEIRDNFLNPVSDAQEYIARAQLPTVEQWKKQVADYKNSSIPLGTLSEQTSQSYKQPNQQQQQQMQPPPQPQQQQNWIPVTAQVPSYKFENDRYSYNVEVGMEDNSYWQLSRTYADFYDIQRLLLDRFPNEAGRGGEHRVLPYIPGPVTYVTDQISNGRRIELDRYVRELIQLPPYISRCDLVQRLFAPRRGDYELDPQAVNYDYRLSDASHSSHPNSQNLSHQSSQQQFGNGSNSNLNNNNPYGDSGYGNGGGGGGGGPGNPHGQPPNQNYWGNGSNTSHELPASGNDGMQSGSLKIKVWFEDDCIAIKVPSAISFVELRDRLMERLKVRDPIVIQYKDGMSGGTRLLTSDRDLDEAIRRNPRLQLYVGLDEWNN